MAHIIGRRSTTYSSDATEQTHENFQCQIDSPAGANGVMDLSAVSSNTGGYTVGAASVTITRAGLYYVDASISGPIGTNTSMSLLADEVAGGLVIFNEVKVPIGATFYVRGVALVQLATGAEIQISTTDTDAGTARTGTLNVKRLMN